MADSITPVISFQFRPIRPEDNTQVEQLIRTVMTEFACTGEGYSIMDAEVSDMYERYNHDKAAFYVVTKSGEEKILGCGGIGPLSGGDATTCELKKMYFYPEIRGLGLGRNMVELCLDAARRLGYTSCYLETVDRMVAAAALYRKMGFDRLTAPLGKTGHTNCEGWYAREL